MVFLNDLFNIYVCRMIWNPLDLKRLLTWKNEGSLRLDEDWWEWRQSLLFCGWQCLRTWCVQSGAAAWRYAASATGSETWAQTLQSSAATWYAEGCCRPSSHNTVCSWLSFKIRNLNYDIQTVQLSNIQLMLQHLTLVLW